MRVIATLQRRMMKTKAQEFYDKALAQGAKAYDKKVCHAHDKLIIKLKRLLRRNDDRENSHS